MTHRGLVSPSGRWVFLVDEAVMTLEMLDEQLRAGEWSLTMTRKERLSHVAGSLAGVMSHRLGWTIDQMWAAVDEEFVEYCTELLAQFETMILEEQVRRS